MGALEENGVLKQRHVNQSIDCALNGTPMRALDDPAKTCTPFCLRRARVTCEYQKSPMRD
jgi:hypothetical protein